MHFVLEYIHIRELNDATMREVNSEGNNSNSQCTKGLFVSSKVAYCLRGLPQSHSSPTPLSSAWVSVKFFLILSAESRARVFSNQHSCITFARDRSWASSSQASNRVGLTFWSQTTARISSMVGSGFT